MKTLFPYRYPKQRSRREQGFSLIEALVAMLILTIGIFALYSLQITSINGNSKAHVLTVASTWGTDQVEYLLALDYIHPDLDNGNHGPVSRDGYDISWAVVDDTPLAGNKSITISVSNVLRGATQNYIVSCIKGQAI